MSRRAVDKPLAGETGASTGDLVKQAETRKAVFLDRDGTLMEEVDYCRDPALVKLLPGVVEGLRLLKARGFVNVIITNQSGIGRGRISLAEYEAVHARLMELIGPGLIDATYYCPDAPDAASERRKPAPGMVLEAMVDLALTADGSWQIGDKAIDLECAARVGVPGILVLTGYGRQQNPARAALVAEDFLTAARKIVESVG